MAVAAGVLNETRRRTLEAVCDTFVPSLEVETGDQVKRDFFARAASDVGVAAQVEGLMADAMMPGEIEGFGQLLDGLAEDDFAAQRLEGRTQILHQAPGCGPEAKLGAKPCRES